MRTKTPQIPFQVGAEEDLEAAEAAELPDRGRVDQEEGRSLRTAHIRKKGRCKHRSKASLSFCTFNITGLNKCWASPHLLWPSGFYEIISKPRRPLIYREKMSPKEGRYIGN